MELFHNNNLFQLLEFLGFFYFFDKAFYLLDNRWKNNLYYFDFL
jgi:hypothetical protein